MLAPSAWIMLVQPCRSALIGSEAERARRGSSSQLQVLTARVSPMPDGPRKPPANGSGDSRSNEASGCYTCPACYGWALGITILCTFFLSLPRVTEVDEDAAGFQRITRTLSRQLNVNDRQ